MNSFSTYTTAIRKLFFKFPVFSAILKQVVFWTIAFQLLGIILYFNGLAASVIYTPETSNPSYLPALVTWLLFGIFYGIILGISDFYLFQRWSKGRSLGKIILLKGMFYFLVMMAVFAFIRYVVWYFFLKEYYDAAIESEITERFWRYYFYLVSIYTLVMSILISFIININRKFGPGVLLPNLLGKYTTPVIEHRVFIFLDLKSSTTYAERLGHVKYSQLIKDCFQEINDITLKYHAEIYQYVGDEMVLCWLIDKDINLNKCVDFYFACKDAFEDKINYYTGKYGILPEFKAGLHFGVVTGVEVGDIKRDVAYHGDTLNVTARIQGQCSANNANLLISGTMQAELSIDSIYHYERIGDIILKGKSETVTVYKVVRAPSQKNDSLK